LGLAITERAVRYHGGRVAAFNRPQGGLLIEIHLPLRARARSRPQPEAVPAGQEA
jgi:signal transduction histidine kinase